MLHVLFGTEYDMLRDVLLNAQGTMGPEPDLECFHSGLAGSVKKFNGSRCGKDGKRVLRSLNG